MSETAYPLQWPAGRPRTVYHRRETGKFDVSFARARDNIISEVKLLCGGRWGAEPHTVISTNVALRRDGLPLAGQRAPDDPGVAVYFVYKKRQMSFACDRWLKIEHNMQAIAKTIEALRGIARWGTGDMLEAAFTGFTALPPPSTRHGAAHLLGRTRRAARLQRGRHQGRVPAPRQHPPPRPRRRRPAHGGSERRVPGGAIEGDDMSSTPHLSDAEIADICDPLVSAAAQRRYLASLGLVVRSKPNGRPLVARAEFERVLVGRAADAEKVHYGPAPDRAALMKVIQGGKRGAQAQGR
jgi:hypothetical protein